MMKARWDPIEWRCECVCVCGMLWLPWKPCSYLCLLRACYNWVLLSYYSLWFLPNMTSQSSPHRTMQVLAYPMSSKLFKCTVRLVWVTGTAPEVKDKGISDLVLNASLKVSEAMI